MMRSEEAGLFYHVRLTTADPGGTAWNTSEHYLRDLSGPQLQEFLARYRDGLPLTFGPQVIRPGRFLSLFVGSTDQPSTVLLPPLKTRFERNAAAEKARTEAEYRRNRIVVFNPYDLSGVFFADRTLMSLASDRTSEFIQAFTTSPKDHILSGNPDPEAQGLSPSGLVALNQRRRFHYLERLYRGSGGDSSRMFHWREVGAALGMDDDTAAVACCYLRQKKLANGEYMTDGISQAGIDEYEQAVSKPDQPTAHFAEQVTINAGHGSNVMLGSPGAQQTLTGGALATDMAGVADLIRELRRALPDFDMARDVREDVEVLVLDLQGEVERASPDRRKVRAGLRSVGHLLGNLSLNVAANAMTGPILEHLHRLLLVFASAAG